MGQLRAFFARSLPEVFWNTEINDTVVRFSFDQQHPACWRSSRLARTIPRLALGVYQNPRSGFGPFCPVCCRTLLVAVRAGLPQHFGVREGLNDDQRDLSL
jgi:hypothetical protein